MWSVQRWMWRAVSELTTGFSPLVSPNATVLVLGTLPSRKSLEFGQYYGHPQNAFWKIMGELFGAHRELPYEERTRHLLARGVAVWDVLAASVRPGSMDADIDIGTAKPNDFDRLFNAYPDIGLVCFNGRTAERLYMTHVAPAIENRSNRLRFHALPSTSPAYAAMSFEEKLDAWQIVSQATQNQGER